MNYAKEKICLMFRPGKYGGGHYELFYEEANYYKYDNGFEMSFGTPMH